MIRRVQTKHLIRLHGLDPTKELYASEQLELLLASDGPRRDVLVRRPGCADFMIYDGNIAGLEVESILPEFAPAAHDTLPPGPFNYGNAAAQMRRVLEQPYPPEHPEVYECKQCAEPRTFLTPRALQGHISRVHRNKEQA